MAIIHNHTKKRVNISNGEFSVDLKADESIEITEESLNGKTELYISWVGFTHAREKLEEEVRKETLRTSYYLHLEIQRHFPLITVLDIKNLPEVTLEEEEVSLRWLLLLRTAYLHRIRCRFDSIECADVRYMFFYEQDKKKFLRLMRLGCVFIFPITLIAIFGMIGIMFTDDTFMEKLFVALFCFCISLCGLTDIYYTIKAKKWEAVHKDASDTDNTPPAAEN